MKKTAQIAILAVLTALAAAGGSALARSWTDARLRRAVLTRAALAAGAIDKQAARSLSGSEKDLSSPVYARLKANLAVARACYPKCRFLYLMGLRPEGQIFFYADSEPAGSRDESPPGQAYAEASAALRRVFDSGEAAVEGPVEDRWGAWVSAFVPLFSGETGTEGRIVFGMDIDASDWRRLVVKDSLVLEAFVWALLACLAGFAALVAARRGRGLTGSRRSRYAVILGVVGVGCSLSLVAGRILCGHEGDVRRDVLARMAGETAGLAQRRLLDIGGIALRSLAARLEDAGAADAAAPFRDAIRRMEPDPAVLAWELAELDAGGVPAGSGAGLRVVAAEPSLRVKAADEPALARAAAEACATGMATMSDPFLIEPSGEYACMLFMPVRASGAPANPARLVCAAVSVKGLFSGRTSPVAGKCQESCVSVRYLPWNDAPVQVWQTPGFGQGTWNEAGTLELCSLSGETVRAPIFAYGRTLEMVLAAPGGLAPGGVPHSGLLVILAGFAVTAAAGAMTKILSEREALLEAEVEKRTDELQESERRFRELADSSGALVWTTGPDLSAGYVNRRWMEFTGLGQDRLEGRGWLEAIHPEDRERCGALAARDKAGAGWSQVCRIRRADGGYGWFKADAVPRANTGGNFAGYICHASDITALKDAQQRLEQAVGRLDAVISGAPTVAIWSYNQNGTILMWNEAAGRLYGMSSAEAVGRNVREALPEEEAGHALDQARDALQTNRPAPAVERQIRSRSGQMIWVYSSLFPVRDSAGCVIEIIRMDVDISSRVRAEEEARVLFRQSERSRKSLLSILEDQQQVQARLRERNEFLDALMDSIPVPVFSKDTAGRYTSCNRAFCEFAGAKKEDIIGKRSSELLGEQGVLHEQKDGALLRTGGSIVYETQHTDPAGELKHIVVQKAVFRGEDGRTAGLVGAILDVTDRRRAEEMRIANEAAEASNRIKSEFVATVSHELRTPLNSVVGFTSALMEGVYGDLSERQRSALENIAEGAAILSRLVEDILDLTRIEAGKLALEFTRVNAKDAAEKAVAFVQRTFSGRKLRFSIECPDSPQETTVVTDAVRLEQILINLLNNAVKFTPDGGVISVKIEAGSDDVAVSVADTGIGIRKEDIERIFEPFRQADSSYARAYGGLGLGLHIVRKLAGALGAAVTAESRGSGKGSVFTVRIPKKGPVPACRAG